MLHHRLMAHAISLFVLCLILAAGISFRYANRRRRIDDTTGHRPEEHRSGADKGYWFPAKRYGWGWGLPLTWQGWTVLAVWFAVVISVSRYLVPGRIALHLVFLLAMILLLVGICYMKGEPPRWRWGDQDN